MRRTVLAAVLAIALTGCAGSDSGGDEPSVPSKATRTATAAPARAEYEQLSKSELRSAVLEVNSLPTGFGEDPDSTGETSKNYCDYKRPFKATATAIQGFMKGSGMSGEYVQIGLRQYGDIDKGAASFKTLVDTMKTCRKDSIDGEPVKFSLLSTPDLEDGSIGIAVVTDDYNVPQFFALSGPTLISVGGGGLMGSDPDELIGLLKKQISAYKQAAKH